MRIPLARSAAAAATLVLAAATTAGPAHATTGRSAAVPPVPSARVGGHIVLDSAAPTGHDTFEDASAVNSPDGTTWIAWLDVAPDNGFNGDPEIKLCTLPVAAAACSHVATYHDPASSTTSLTKSTSVQDVHLSRTEDGALYLVFQSFSTVFAAGTVKVMTSTDAGQTLSVPTAVGTSPDNHAVLEDARVSAGFVDTVFDFYTKPTAVAGQAQAFVGYGLFALDGRDSQTSPTVEWAIPLQSSEQGRARLIYTVRGPLVASPNLAGKDGSEIGFMQWNSGPLRDRSSWSDVTAVNGTDGSYIANLATGPSGTFLATSSYHYPTVRGGNLLRLTATGFVPVGPTISSAVNTVVSVAPDGRVGALTKTTYGGSDPELSYLSSSDLYHFTPSAFASTAADDATSQYPLALALAAGGSGVGVYAYDGGTALYAVRVGSVPLATSTVTATIKNDGQLRASLLTGCVHNPAGTLPVALSGTFVKAAGRPTPGVLLDGKAVKAPSRLPAAYALNISKLQPGSKHTVVLTARPASKSKLKTLALKITFTMCATLAPPLPA